MTCPHCGRENRPDAQFCAHCARALEPEPRGRVALTLTPAQIAATAGEPATSCVRAHNDGSLVEHVRLVLTGAAAAWTTVAPERLPVMPGEAAEAVVTVHPPRTAALAAGRYALIVQALTQAGGETLGHADAIVSVAAFDLVTARVVPRQATRWRSTAIRLELVNAGNEAVTLALGATDSDDMLRFGGVRPATVAAGATIGVPLRVSARRVRLVGTIEPHDYTIAATEPGTEVVATGTFRHRALISPTLLAVIVVLIALWATVQELKGG